MNSVKGEVFQYLKEHPKASNIELYNKFPEYNRGSIKVYRNKFLQVVNNYNNTLNITQVSPEAKKDETIDINFFLSLLNEVPLFPAYIYSKLYWKTKKYENQERYDYSIVDLYIELYNKIISGKYNMNKIYDFCYNINEELRRLYVDMHGEGNNKPMDLESLIIQKNFYGIRLTNCVESEISEYIVNDYNERILNIKEIKKKKKGLIEIERSEKEKIEFYNELKNYILTRILVSYLYFDLQLNAPHLRNRDLKFIYRDLTKINLLCYMHQYINKKPMKLKIYNSELFYDTIEVYNKEILKFDKNRQIKPQFEKEVLYNYNSSLYSNYITEEDFEDDFKIIKDKRNKEHKKDFQEAIKEENIRKDFEQSGQIYDTNKKVFIKITNYEEFKAKKIEELKRFYNALMKY